MKKLILALILVASAYGDVLKVSDFQTDLYSKSSPNATKKISVSLEAIGRDVQDNESYFLDALNVIIGSFYVEDILTSMGKEKFKETLIKYAAKKHGLDIDDVLILNIKTINNLELSEILKAVRALKNETPDDTLSVKSNEKKSKNNEIILNPDLNSLNQKPIDLNSIKEFNE